MPSAACVVVVARTAGRGTRRRSRRRGCSRRRGRRAARRSCAAGRARTGAAASRRRTRASGRSRCRRRRATSSCAPRPPGSRAYSASAPPARSRAPTRTSGAASAAARGRLRSDLRRSRERRARKPSTPPSRLATWRTVGCAAPALPARRQCGIERTALRAVDGRAREDRELPVAPRGKHRHDLGDQRDRRRAPMSGDGEPPRELDRLDVGEPGRMHAAHRGEVAVLAAKRERDARRHQRGGGREDPRASTSRTDRSPASRDLAIEVVRDGREVDRLHTTSVHASWSCARTVSAIIAGCACCAVLATWLVVSWVLRQTTRSQRPSCMRLRQLPPDQRGQPRCASTSSWRRRRRRPRRSRSARTRRS